MLCSLWSAFFSPPSGSCRARRQIRDLFDVQIKTGRIRKKGLYGRQESSEILAVLLHDVEDLLWCDIRIEVCESVPIPCHRLQFVPGKVRIDNPDFAKLSGNRFVLCCPGAGETRQNVSRDVKDSFESTPQIKLRLDEIVFLAEYAKG